MTGLLSLGVYRLATRCIAPAAPMLLAARARRGKEDPNRLGERLGRAGAVRPPGRLAWVHGVSVGESLSLLTLIERLHEEQPEVAVLCTSGTPASADLLARRLPASVIHQYFPLDLPGSVDRFLDHWKPDLVVFAESELWPNVILGAAARSARMALVSARLSEGSVRTWRRAPAAARALFSAFELVMARDEKAADRLRGLGVSVDGVADMKLGASPLPVDGAELARMKALVRQRTIILTASTHPGEEALLLDRFAATKGGAAGSMLIVAPRHVERGPSIAMLARERGLSVTLRSEARDPGAHDVYVADTVGEFGLWYRLARLAFVGGSLTPHVGGHNPLEPARLGCPVISGDQVDNWPIYRDMARCGAVILVDRADRLDATFRLALVEPEALARMARAAQSYVAERDAEISLALGRIMALLD